MHLLGPSFSLPGKPVSAVYFLWKDGKVIYVGKSSNVLQRIGTHISTVDCDSASYIPVPPSDLLETEALYIRQLKPALNCIMRPSHTGLTSRLSKRFHQDYSPPPTPFLHSP